MSLVKFPGSENKGIIIIMGAHIIDELQSARYCATPLDS